MSIADVRAKLVPIQLDKERHLKYDFNAFCEIEERLGSVDAAFDILQNFSIKGMRTLLWAGLIHEDDSLTEREVGAMVGFSGVEHLAKLITEALVGAMPEAKNQEPKPTKKK